MEPAHEYGFIESMGSESSRHMTALSMAQRRIRHTDEAAQPADHEPDGSEYDDNDEVSEEDGEDKGSIRADGGRCSEFFETG